MDLICYVHRGWEPLIRPAPAGRDWMDATAESFAYRCLPLNIANAHGWEILSPCSFDAIWRGGAGVEALEVRSEPEAVSERVPVSLFGHGVLTFHVEAIFRTPPGWNLWVGGSPNRAKDGISPLGGVIETDWSPFTFTMNWRFTRPGFWIHFDQFEPFCFIFPVQRGALEEMEPRFAPLDQDPATLERFQAWSSARHEFHRKVGREPPQAPADRWQKHYYRGVDVSGQSPARDHQTKLRLKVFDRSGTPEVPEAPADDALLRATAPRPASDRAPDEIEALRLALAKREWLLEEVERQRRLATGLIAIERRAALTSEEFLERYYAANRPVILTGEMDGWPALKRWTPEHLTAYNPAQSSEALAVLHRDLGSLDKFLDPAAAEACGMMRIGPSGALTPLHHDLANNFIAQLVGRNQIKLAPAAEVGKLCNAKQVFSEIADLDDPGLDPQRYPRLATLQVYDLRLEPGEILFTPFGWWRQVRALDFSVTITYSNFRWPNEAYASYPER